MSDLEAEALRLREGIESALRRYDNEDDGTLRVRDGLTWAMVSDLREALAATQPPSPDTSVDREETE